MIKKILLTLFLVVFFVSTLTVNADDCRSSSLNNLLYRRKSEQQKYFKLKKRYERYVQSNQKLYTSSQRNRYQAIKDVPLSEIYTAPGHASLRDTPNVISLSESIEANLGKAKTEKNFQNVLKKLLSQDGKIILNVHTDWKNNSSKVTAIEIIDGNHRMAAILLAARRTFKNKKNVLSIIPENIIEVLVNGYSSTSGKAIKRWVPLETVKDSVISYKHLITDGFWVKGDTAEIMANIPTIDPRFNIKHRGISLKSLLRKILKSSN